jgi:hypothetical protein
MTDLVQPSKTAAPLTAAEHDRATRRELFDSDNYQLATLPPEINKARRALKDRRLMHYNRLAATVSVTNLAILLYGLTGGGWFSSDGIALGNIANVMLLNFTMAILIRQQYVINLLFKAATAIPTDWPLRLRWTAGKVYHFGGIHVGGAVGGSLWFLLFLGSVIYHSAEGLPGVSGPLIGVSVVLVALLVAMIGFSLPRFRAKYHDNFEKMHRFGGWTALALFWVHTLLFVAAGRGDQGLFGALVGSLAVWALTAVLVSIALPWLRLRRVPVNITRPSNHVALVEFDYGVTPFAGSSTTVSRSPLHEWHSFANVPSPDRDGFRLTISRAGDWTGQLIDDMPSHVWVKGIPTAGVGNIDKLFKRVVWVATGSGIGPTLPHLLSQEVPAHLVWATRDPWETYGHELVDEILAVQPQATIWDTTAKGKPDMVQLAYRAVEAFDAEAVIVISNKNLTWQVVEGMERVGIPAYGAIWDS